MEKNRVFELLYGSTILLLEYRPLPPIYSRPKVSYICDFRDVNFSYES
jgi:hypothetical protein